jgi:hypothetical protein
MDGERQTFNEHRPTKELRQRISDLAIAGTPKYLIAKVVKLDDDTLNKYYAYELECAKTEAIERIAKTVYVQAVEGDSKAQALYLKTQGASHGWVEKQVVENIDSAETKELQSRVQALEQEHQRDY